MTETTDPIPALQPAGEVQLASEQPENIANEALHKIADGVDIPKLPIEGELADNSHAERQIAERAADPGVLDEPAFQEGSDLEQTQDVVGQVPQNGVG